MKQIVLLLAIGTAFLMFACNNADKNSTEDKDNCPDKEQVEKKKDSESSPCVSEDKIVHTCAGTITVDSILGNEDALAGKKLSICGMVSHVCDHSARRLFVQSEESEKVLIVVPEEEMEDFKQEFEEEKMIFEGKLLKDTSGNAESHHGHSEEFYFECTAFKVCKCPGKEDKEE